MRVWLLGMALVVGAAAARAAVLRTPRPRHGLASSARVARRLALPRPLGDAFDRLARRRRAAAVARDLPVFLESVARALRSGLSSEAAVTESLAVLEGPVRADVDAICRSLDLGASLDQALAVWEDSDPATGAALAAAALSLGATSGGSRARAVDAVAATLRERTAIRAEVTSLSTQARASAVVMAATPAGFLLLATSADPGTAGFLVGTQFGVTCLVGGLLLEAAGAAWMMALTRSAT